MCITVGRAGVMKGDKTQDISCLDCRFYVPRNKVFLVPRSHADKPSASKILFVAVWHSQHVLVHLCSLLCCPGPYDGMIK